MSLTLSNSVLKSLSALELSTRRSILGLRQGGHRSYRRGHGSEFSDYRRYELGDHPRLIDWGVYARTERLTIKQYQEEEQLTVSLFLDGSNSMRFPKEDEKWERVCQLALALSYIALSRGDRILISVLGGEVSPFFGGLPSYGAIVNFLEKHSTRALPESVEPQSFSRDSERALLQALEKLHFPGVGIVLSDFLFDEGERERLLRPIRGKGLDVHAIQVLGKNDFNPFLDERAIRAIDSESGEEHLVSLEDENREAYQELLKTHQDALQSYFFNRDIPLMTISAAHTLEDIVRVDFTRLSFLK